MHHSHPGVKVKILTWATAVTLPYLSLMLLTSPSDVGAWLSTFLSLMLALTVTSLLLVVHLPQPLVGLLLPFLLILCFFAGGEAAESYGLVEDSPDLFNGWTLWVGAIWAVTALVLVGAIYGVRTLTRLARGGSEGD